MHVTMSEQTVGYRRTYKLRKPVPGRKYVVAGIPYEVLEREAALRNLTVDQFIKLFEVVAEYDNFDGIRQTFREINKDDNNGNIQDK